MVQLLPIAGQLSFYHLWYKARLQLKGNALTAISEQDV
jgi:hypothetical protein